MPHISTPFSLEKIINFSASIYHPTPIADQVSAQIRFGIKAPPSRISTLSLAVRSMWEGKQSTIMIKVGVQCHIKPKFMFLVKIIISRAIAHRP